MADVILEEGSAAEIPDYDYNLASQRTTVEYETGHKIEYTYDSYGRLDTLTNKNASQTVMSSFDYDYDDDGLRTKATLNGGDYIDYGYDGLNRLLDEHKKDSSGGTLWQREYEYDKVGNRTKLIKDDGSGDVTYDYSYNGLGQLTKVEWTVGTTTMRTSIPTTTMGT